MTDAPPLDLVPLINAALDRVRHERGITNDKALGEALKVSNAAIYYWRQGDLGKSARVLIPLLLREYGTPPSRTIPRYGRRRRRPVEV